MRYRSQLLCVVCLLTLILSPDQCASQALQCVGVGSDGCSCVFDDGSGVIDVSSLANNDGTARFQDISAPDSYLYSFNPCKPFSQLSCTNAAVCQIQSDQTAAYTAGDANTAEWSYDGVNAVVYYVSSSEGTTRQSFVTYVCDESATTPSMTAAGETAPTVYELTVTSKCACKNGCSGGDDNVRDDSGLSGGSILLIVAFVLLFVYLVAGMLFNRRQRQTTGIEMVPNIAFWRALPGLIKDGFLFTFGKFRPKKSGYDEV